LIALLSFKISKWGYSKASFFKWKNSLFNITNRSNMSKDKIVGVSLLIIGLLFNFSAIEFKGLGFLAGAICATGIGLFLFDFKIFKKINK
jgi:hypothetical protein